jgi:hypothetical protein
VRLLVSVLRSCWPERWRCEASVVGLLQCVSWLDPVGRHSYRSAAHKELQRFLSPREDPVGAAVRGLQSPACCVLTEKDVCAVTKALVHGCGW